MHALWDYAAIRLQTATALRRFTLLRELRSQPFVSLLLLCTWPKGEIDTRQDALIKEGYLEFVAFDEAVI